MLDQQIEVIITHLDDHYKAVSPAFPRCKGLGETREQALQNLAQSIGNAIGRLAKASLKSLFLSGDFSSITVDGSNESKTQKVTFNLPLPGAPQPKKGLSMRFDHIPEVTPKWYKNSGSDVQDAIPDLSLSHSVSQRLNASSGLRPFVLGQEEGFVFGIPISLN